MFGSIMRFFSSKTKKTVTATRGAPENTAAYENDQLSAIGRVLDAIETIDKRREFLERKEERLKHEAAEKARAGGQREALSILRTKKIVTSEISSLETKRMALESTRMSLESAQSTQLTIGALRSGLDAQKAAYKQMDVTSLDNLMMEVQEARQEQEELNQMLCQSVPETDEDLMNELNQLDTEIKLSSMPVPPTTIPGASIAAASPIAAPSVLSSSRPLTSQQEYPSLAADGVPSTSEARRQTDEEQLRELQMGLM